MTWRDSLYPHEYIQYLVHFHGDRDYFECHEILEEYWKKNDPGNKDSIWVGLILLSVSNYHHRRANFNGAKRTLKKAIKIFLLQEKSLKSLRLNQEQLMSLLQQRLDMMEKEIAYNNFDLPIYDSSLIDACKKTASKMGIKRGSESDLMNMDIIHKHLVRDRTSVIEERNRAVKFRKGNK